MRCPDCHAEVDPAGIRSEAPTVCAQCGAALVDTGEAADPAAGAAASPGPAPEARLGTFHPAVAERVAELLYRRAIEHRVLTEDGVSEIRIDPSWRDDVRTELTLTWADLVGGLDPDVAAELRAVGGRAPGWLDAPQGGHIDRSGRLVVSASGDDEEEEARVIGPALLAFGAILAIIGWYVLDSAGLTTIGAAMALVGLLTPR